ncbi:MAG TPA: Sec-independent protein translocase protein TatB [Burkholderiales bacterium]|jgi:sec-independent protein translocase protein TatB|nr:Sec-independent protein translocase protein TatB [Burkholderiales bacterium]
MFDIGFSELLVIGVVALIVIGPERLPRVARTIGHLMGRMQRYVADVKADIDREVELEELRKMRDSVQQAATSIESSVQSELNKAETELNQAAKTAAGEEVTPAPAGEAQVSPAPDSSAGAQVSPAQKDAPAIIEKTNER